MKHLLFVFLIGVASAQQCRNSADRAINGRCFTLVNQQLSWQDARDWCHHRSPVSPSYLATVTDTTTANFLASYARSSFNTNEGFFWIGLFRNNASSRWQWDDGTPVTWTNFALQNSYTFVAESITNARFTAFTIDAKFNFICSYNPNAVSTGGTTEVPFSETPSTIATTADYTSPPVNYTNCRIGSRYNRFSFFYPANFDLSTYYTVKNALFSNLAKRYYSHDFKLGMIDRSVPDVIDYEQNLNGFLNYLDTNPPNISIAADPAQSSKVISIISQLSSKQLQKGDFQLYLLTRIPEDDDLTELEYNNLTLTAQSIFIIMNNDVLNSTNVGKVEVLNKIAAISNGHFFVVNNPSLSSLYKNDYRDIVSRIMNISANGQFIFTRNLASSYLTTENNLGVFLVPQSLTSSVRVYITMSMAYKNASALTPATVSVIFSNNSTQVEVSCPENYHGSNFYFCQIDLEPGKRVNVKLIYKPSSSKNDILLRFWTDTLISYQSAFISTYGNIYPFNPNEYQGAAYQVWYPCVRTEGEIIITDCHGQVSKKFDAQQFLPVEYVGDLPSYTFAPFFCDNRKVAETCVAGTENKYDVHFSGGLFSFSQSFICRPGVGQMNSNCTNMDENGNYYCNRDQLPYKRGPLGQVPDCLGNGFVAYNLPSRFYYCACNPGYSGVSCEQVSK